MTESLTENYTNQSREIRNAKTIKSKILASTINQSQNKNENKSRALHTNSRQSHGGSFVE